MKSYLDNLVKKYETKDFIKDDPIQFAHKFTDKKDIEIAAFISALFSFGKREMFIKKLDEIFNKMQNEPHNFICNYDDKEKLFDGFCYRFVADYDLKCMLLALHNLYVKDKMSVGELFFEGKNKESMLTFVSDYFYQCQNGEIGMGFCHLFAKPQNKGAMKRINMFLRWMVRKGPVDLGLWDFIKTDELLIPLDVHVGKISRSLGLLQRNSNDFKSVIELTQKLKEFDQKDPIKYDFALFGAGVNINKN